MRHARERVICMKKTKNKTKTRLVAVVFLISVFIIAGCGGGGSSSVAPSQPSVSQVVQDGYVEDLAKEVPYDIDVILDDGRTAGRSTGGTYSSELNDILEIKAYFEGLPDDAYNIPPVWKVILGKVKEKRLTYIVRGIEKKIEKGHYKIAYWKIAKKLLPRVDGCDGGVPRDDYIVDCAVKSPIYATAVEMMAVIEEVVGPWKNRDKGKNRNDDDDDDDEDGRDADRSAYLIDMETFKNNLLNSIDTIKGYIENAGDSAFSGVVADPRGTLLGVLTVAANYVIDEDFTSAKETLENTFLPMIDGGIGGDASDDLIQEWVYSTEQYASTINLTDQMLQDTTITQVTVTPASGIMEAGQSLQFTATCLYSDLVEKECNGEVDWFSDNPSVADFTAPGLLAGYTAGDTTVRASAEDVNSGWLPVKVVGAGVFWDPFDRTYLDPTKWSDAYQYGSTIQADGSRLHLSGGAYSHAQVVPVQYFNVGSGEKVEVEVEIDTGTSGGSCYVQSFGIYDRSTTGVAVGIIDGDGFANPMIYISSPIDYRNITVSDANGVYKIVYQSGVATVTLNGSQIGQVNARLDGTRVTFFLFASSGGGTSYFDLYFDNFITNQPNPGETVVSIENNTRPFLPDGSGGLFANEVFTLRLVATPYQADVKGRLMDAATFQQLIPEFSMNQTATPGIYEYTAVMPAGVPATVVFSASDDGFNRMELYTRRIDTGTSAARSVARATGAMRPTDFLPAFLLPMELRDAL